MRGKGTALAQRDADDLLAEFALHGSESAFGEVVRRYAGMVFAAALRVAGNAHDAEDATQMTFLQLAVQMKSGRPVKRLGPWLRQVAKRAAMDVRRGRRRRETHEQRHGDERRRHAEAMEREQGRNGHATGGGDIDLDKLNDVLAQELGRLPARYRLPLISLYFGGMSRPQIARELGCTVGTLGVRIHRGRQILARRLEERGVAPAARLAAGGLLAAAIASAMSATLVQKTAAAAARVSLAQFAESTAAGVLAAIKGSAAATALAKLKVVAAVALVAALTAVAGGAAAANWDAIAPHLPTTVRNLIDLGRWRWRPTLPNLRAPAVPVPVAAAAPSDPPHEQPVATSAETPVPPRAVASAVPAGAPAETVPAQGGGGPLHVASTPSPAATPQANLVPKATPTALIRTPLVVPATHGLAHAGLAAPRLFDVPRIDVGAGRLVHPGGTRVIGGLSVGADVGRSGTYVIPRGALVVRQDVFGNGGFVEVGRTGTGTLHLGSGDSGGLIVQPRGPRSPRPPASRDAPAPPPSFVVRGDVGGGGTVVGWGGAIGDGGAFVNNGKVIADGGGLNRNLVFLGYGAVTNTIDNPPGGDRGWFARDGGRLVLPKIDVAAGTHVYTWGEDANDPQIDLVNSVRITLHDAQNPGKLDVSLLDKTRPEVPTLPTGHTFIGVWSIDTGLTRPAGVDLTVRYDDGLAAMLGLNEGSLKLWRFDGAQWVRINDSSFMRDMTSHILNGHADSLSLFAVSAPEPSAAGLALLAGPLLLRRRRGRARFPKYPRRA